MSDDRLTKADWAALNGTGAYGTSPSTEVDDEVLRRLLAYVEASQAAMRAVCDHYAAHTVERDLAEKLDALRALLLEESPSAPREHGESASRVVRARILASVSPLGAWAAFGDSVLDFNNPSDRGELLSNIYHNTENALHLVVVDLPLPEIREIREVRGAVEVPGEGGES